MLYKLDKKDDKFASLDPLPFQGLPLEKELEDLLAQNLFDVLFEESNLMPIFQERAWQEEADIYALNRAGDLVIFELKRDGAGGGAVHQAMRYCEKASRFNYEELQRKLRIYKKDDSLDLQQEHRSSFELENALGHSEFNREQQLMVIGSASDDELIRNVDYWKSKGLSLDFVPYRVYKIDGAFYFEFFSLPYDKHSNPAHRKGVIVDTNLSYDEDSIWYMCENDRVAAFGDIKGVIYSLGKGDIVFLYHKGRGIVAAGEVLREAKDDDEWDATYCDLNWLTPKPSKGSAYPAMAAWQIREAMGFGFFWARTLKVPYMNMEESAKLLTELNKVLSPGAVS